ncbi:MAG: 5'-nucleotidase [Thermoprotei archaeon]|nr:MAG: 5'-nucleotidase [Thermoprotei archaeon]
MPVFMTNEEEFIKITERARECRVKRIEKEGIAKVKARTKRYLYTIKIPLEKLEEFLKKLKCPQIVEV